MSIALKVPHFFQEFLVLKELLRALLQQHPAENSLEKLNLYIRR
jgi:hypothetical protein